MSETTMIIITVVVLLTIGAIVMGRRLGRVGIGIGKWFKGTVEGQPGGATISGVKITGKKNVTKAEGRDAAVKNTTISGEEHQTHAKSPDR